MTIRTYQLAFYGTDGNLQTVMDITGLMQLRYSKVLNNFGALQFTVPLILAHSSFSTLDTVCQVMVSDGPGDMVIDGSYLLRYHATLENEGQEVMVVAGVGLEFQLWRRIFIAEDDALSANGFSTKSGAAETVMRSIVDDQCVSPAVNSERAITNLVLDTDGGAGNTVAFREEDSDTRVIEFLKKLARPGGVDFWIDYDPTIPTFTVKFGTVGSDRRKSTYYPGGPFLYFAPQLGNIDQPELKVDRREEQNAVHIFGQGPAGSRLRYSQDGDGLTDSPWNRNEFGVQAKNTKVLADWLTEADSALLQAKAGLTAFSFKPKVGSRGAQYGSDWFLGDLCTGQYQGDEFEMRITGVEVTVDGDGVQTEPEMELL